ncbi:MAG: hypothetical protein M4D80_27900 [Myxococcota bacterium]|nr:hypothetical protein [Myxococcota bacterium]
MRRLVLVFAACSSGSPQNEQKPAPASTAKVKPPIGPVTGAHGGEISLLAVTADAAVSADVTGGVRLWPTLDGTREPIVVAAPMATGLAIAHDGGGFAIAVTDAADHVVMIRLDNKGHVRSRRQLGTALQVEIVGDSVLALREDQVIDQIAFDGTLRAQLPAETGTRVESLITSGAQLVAIVIDEKQRHARRIELAPLAWGDTSAALALGDSAAVLGSDGSIIAMNTAGQISQFAWKTGKEKPACPQTTIPSHRRVFDGELAIGFNAPIGVVGKRVACVVDGTFSWFDIETGSHTTARGGSSLVPATMAVAGDRMVATDNHQLVIATHERTDYLGYGFRVLTHVRSVPTGLLIGKGDQEPVLLDDKFRERARFALPKLRVDWTDLVPVDDRFVIASSTRPGSGDVWGNGYQIAIYDSVKQVMHQVLPYRARMRELVFEAATGLLVATDGNTTMLARLDPATHSLGNEVTLALEAPPKQVVLLDPKLSGGIIALAIRDEGGGGLIVQELHAADVPRLQEISNPTSRAMKPRTTYRISGELRGVDRAGRLYVYNLMYADKVGVYVGGQNVAYLVGAQVAKLRASPDAAHVIAVDHNRLTLFTSAGKKVWETAAWGSSEVDWTSAGMLYARFPHALARIDETGALAERQCGWAFGISSTPRDSSGNAPSVCDVAP